MRSICLWAAIICLAFACQKKPVSQQELESYVHDPRNGLRQATTIGGVQVQVIYRPSDCFVAQDLANRAGQLLRAKDLQEKYGGQHYFLVNFSRNGKELLHTADGINQYSSLLQTLAFRMNDFIELVTSRGDTIPVLDHAFDRTYGMAANNSVLVVFPKQDVEATDWIQLNLREFGVQTGNIKFQFTGANLRNIPPLDTSSLQ